ncbi:MAG: GyrI-like domain-containing protein [Gillisia sp.]
MDLEWRIEELEETRLVGKGSEMNFSGNKTRELWEGFMPNLKKVKNREDDKLYSVEIYNDPFFFENFDPEKKYEKWAGVKVSNLQNIPEGLEKLVIPQGKYAVFNYKGKPGDAEGTYRYIFRDWLPNSEFSLDDRPHLAIMEAKYKKDDPNAEEELWIPVKK